MGVMMGAIGTGSVWDIPRYGDEFTFPAAMFAFWYFDFGYIGYIGYYTML